VKFEITNGPGETGGRVWPSRLEKPTWLHPPAHNFRVPQGRAQLARGISEENNNKTREEEKRAPSTRKPLPSINFTPEGKSVDAKVWEPNLQATSRKIHKKAFWDFSLRNTLQSQSRGADKTRQKSRGTGGGRHPRHHPSFREQESGPRFQSLRPAEKSHNRGEEAGHRGQKKRTGANAGHSLTEGQP